MNAVIGPLGYCTNVHAGEDLPTTRANLEKYAVPVRQLVSPDKPMGVGLWLSARAAEHLLAERRLPWFADWLHDAQLIPYTVNGFPYGDFHDRIVKHRVYVPTWWEAERLNYTLNLITVQHALLPPGMPGTISTLPIAWGQPHPTHEQLIQAGHNLRVVAERLRDLERETGRYIRLCLEPEPGCFLQRSSDLVRFFQDYLCRDGNIDSTYRYIQVCHDVCHAAVMFESQHDVFRTYHDANISIGKIQVSAAVATPDLSRISSDQRAHLLSQLREFQEERYLHQTVVHDTFSGLSEFYEDLPLALKALENRAIDGTARVHFHVPIYAEDLGPLQTTQAEIIECVRACRYRYGQLDWEIETYAWGVLPQRWQRPSLSEGIAEEINWFQRLLSQEFGDRSLEDPP